MTKDIKVTLNHVDKIKKFTDINEKSQCDVRVFITDDVTISGDSVMGIFAMDLTSPFRVRIEAESEESVQKLLARYSENNIPFKEGLKRELK